MSSSSSSSNIVNEELVTHTWQESADLVHASQCDISISDDSGDELQLITTSNNLNFTDFVSEGWARLSTPYKSVLQTNTRTSQQFELDMSASAEAPKIMSLDGEDIDIIGPIRIGLLTDKITMFCSKSQAAVTQSNVLDVPSSTGSLFSGRSVTSNLIPNSNKRFN